VNLVKSILSQPVDSRPSSAPQTPTPHTHTQTPRTNTQTDHFVKGREREVLRYR